MGKLLTGDAREILATMPESSVHCCITSPPYWGLRDYGCPKVIFSDGWTGQFGLEPTPEMYVEHTLEFLRAIHRVLRDDGTCWWVIGDSYSGGHRKTDKAQTIAQGNERDLPVGYRPSRDLDHPSIKPKDLVMIPFRVALAAQADGWWVRSVIIWSKPNPMPESVRDRPTTAHEYVLLLTKSARYYYDADAIREPHIAGHLQKQLSPVKNRGEQKQYAKQGLHDFLNPMGRNRRTVWEIPTAPFSGPHYATFPPKLVEPMILTTPTKVCAECGAGWERVTEKRYPQMRDVDSRTPRGQTAQGLLSQKRFDDPIQVSTVGFRPTCSCPGLDGDGPGSDCADYNTNWPTKSATILDPFCGTGTTLWQANALGRDWIGIDIDPKSIEMAKERLGLFITEEDR